MDVFINFISAIIGGIFVWGIQQFYQNKRETNKSKFIKLKHKDKIIDYKILNDLKPGINLDLMKEYLGNPFKIFKKDDSIFSDKLIETNSFLYTFKNADVKITSKNNLTIDSITVLPKDKKFNILDFTESLNLNSNNINVAKVNQNLITISKHTFIASRHDYRFAIKYSLTNPLYSTITLYGIMKDTFHEYFEKKDPNLFLDGLITGICISDYDGESYYIYDYELR